MKPPLKPLFEDVFKEYFRPWKIGSLAIGLLALVAGSLHYKADDWDIGISIVMGVLTYLTAPYCVQVVKSLQWKVFPVMILFYWFTVDGSYTIYNSLMGHPVSMDLRVANLFASSLLYILCGLLWSPKMSVSEIVSKLVADCGKYFQTRKRGKV